ncbi:MAG: proline--tRNA ligase [Candidatus Chloroheliales bacterium]|nr:MAG: proline--tRNA ligase [Chloroflexota bacterium]
MTDTEIKQEDSKMVEEIPDIEDDFSAWYNDVVQRAKLADYSPVRGSMVIRPYGYGLWENMRDHLDRRIKDSGCENAYFPLFIPLSFLQKEAEHVEGFAPQVALVTEAGGEKLTEPLVVRPTSEAIICYMYSQWVQSWRDLPILINQWANVVRWEKVTRLFLRTAEFLWQEGHTCHATLDEAEERTIEMLNVYNDFAHQDLAIPTVMGRKSESEKFAGALRTYTIEALLQDGKALQSGTSHNLGDHFARAFDIQFLNKSNVREYAYSTSWGLSTRMVGGLIMTHGDANGLVLPPKVAPVQAIIIPIWRKEGEREAVMNMVDEVEKLLKAAGVRVKVDRDEEHTPGWKYAEYELRGVPLRLEIGPKDVEKNSVMVVRRDNRAKQPIAKAELATAIPALLTQFQAEMYQRAMQRRDAETRTVASYEEFKQIIADKRGFVDCWWDGSDETEAAIKAETKATIRCIPLQWLDSADADHAGGEAGAPQPDIYSGQPGRYRVLYARSY